MFVVAAQSLEEAPVQPHSLRPRSPRLGERERRIVLAIAAAIVPPGSVFEPGGEGTLRRFEQWLEGATAFQMGVIKSLLWAAELGAVPSTGRRLTSLSPERASRFFEDWASSQ